MQVDKELENELFDIANKVERLRVHYMQYFMGIEKYPPLTLHEQLERQVRNSPLNNVRKGALKFRFSALLQRYRIYETYWDRVMREIEEGKFKRDMFRGMIEKEIEETTRGGEGQAEKRFQTLFEEYIKARQSLGLPIEGITEEAFYDALEKQRQIHAEKLGVKDIDFAVSIKDGKVVLLARPKK